MSTPGEAGQSDAFGHALYDWALGGTEVEVIERDDGFTEDGAGREVYLADFSRWPSYERRAMRYVRGRVIDVGCGAGRVPLCLQERGFDVVGLDASTLAVRAARRMGVKNVWRMTVDELSGRIATFDTIVLFGNNFGIFGTPDRSRKLLREWARAVRPGTLILAESTSPYCGGAPAFDRGYYRRNQLRGLMPGQSRMRVRYRQHVGPWFDWLFVSRREMRSVLRGTGWRQLEIVGGPASEPYVAILERR